MEKRNNNILKLCLLSFLVLLLASCDSFFDNGSSYTGSTTVVTYNYTASIFPRSPVVNEKCHVYLSFPYPVSDPEIYQQYYNEYDYPFILEITEPDGNVEILRTTVNSYSCSFSKVGLHKCHAYTDYLNPARENYEWDFEVTVRASEEDDIS